MERPKKIAILTSLADKQYGTLPLMIQRQAEGYAKKGSEVTIFVFEGDIQPKDVELCIIGAPKSTLLRRLYFLFFPLDIFKIVKYVKILKNFDLIVCHHYPLNWLAYLAKRIYGIEYIAYTHGMLPPEKRSTFHERLYTRLMWRMWLKTLSNADKLICVSEFLRNELKKNKIDIENTEIRYNTIDSSRFHKGIDGSKIRNKYGIGTDPLILFVGVVTYTKGVHLLVDAFKIVQRELPRAKLLIVGNLTRFKNYYKKIKTESNNSIVFTGFIPNEELPYYYAACDLYATATLYETFDLPIAEAQACGKPVVAFDIGAHKEIIDESGMLVDVGDIDKLAKMCIAKLKEEKYEK